MTLQFVLVLYGLALCVLSLVSLNRYVLISLFRSHHDRRFDERTRPASGVWPVVTVQLPIYNEYYVAERLIRSACALDYPRQRLQIQILDDSTDETLALTRALASHYSMQGFDIVHLHRPQRTGFKSGALDYGLKRARGELLAIFDADFVIPADFLRRTVPHFDDPQVGIVQTRWSYLNDDYSLLTRATTLGLDGQFAVEQSARSWGGLFLTFNGTAGVLRASCIEGAGGWQHDTITEDLDLSYRAQLAGWRINYLLDVTCDSEIPADVHGLKAQQFSWTKGTQETARKMLPRLLRSDVSRWQKLKGSLHLLANSTYPFLLVAGILNPLVVYAAHAFQLRIFWPISAYFIFSLFGTCSYYWTAERALYKKPLRRMLYFPIFMALSIGLSINNAQAAIEGWLGRKSPFLRTPKYDITKRGQSWQRKAYRSPVGWSVVGEVTMSCYTLLGIAYAITRREYGALPFLVLFASGYTMLSAYSLQHHFAGRGRRVSPTETAAEPARLTSGGVAELELELASPRTRQVL